MSEEGRNAEEVRYRALLELDVSRLEAREELVTGLHDESWRVRRAAAEGLVRLPERGAVVERLIAVLGERDETGARNAAAEALSGMGASAVQPLVHLLGHADPDLRKFAADILGQLALPEAEGALVAVLLEDGDLNVRVAAAEALGRVGGRGAAFALERVLSNPEPLLRLSALESLAALRHPPPLADVVPLLNNPLLKRSAYRVLGLIERTEVVALVCRGLAASESRSTRESALVALGQHSARMADGSRPAMYAAVGEALRRLLGAVSWVTSALESGDIEVKTGALVAAAALREPRLAPLVAEVAQEERLVPEVMRTLACFGPETGRELLASMDRLSFPAREAAGQVLVEMVDESFVPELVQMLDWGEVDLKGVAARALGRTGALEAVEPLAGFLSNPELAGVAARALVALSAGFRARVLQALQTSLEQGAQPVVLNALVRVGGTAQLPLVRRIAREGSEPLRATAVEVLAAVDPAGGLELTRVALVDEAPRVRAAAVRVLGQVGDVSLAPLLQRALADDALEVRLAALEAVGECGAVALAEDLEALVRHPDGAIAFRAVRSLARLGVLRDEVIQHAVAHEDHEVVKAALLAGAASGVGGALALGLLGHAHWDVRAAAARVLADSREERLLPPLMNALVSETDALARRALVDAVERLSGR
ncbi:PBS lyase HEAT-like repeat protein [Cystobacter fuscus DSM 2262]|uniref:PBS lyase HEAT-like repeat protein n=1 Tax=Cystobacter fuscus (strain ATCC 25194 / DSM 2262 / NBRC 100088 / M29) TaxID=1242864 RepID=S9Q912_CYSF2|nr:HEAT repeat domain-containing protein [Cystobacter fuscus]EPX57844.1 PBS lyase HEAT-like repeat protein [Cystobacter fuscus DSM 2262]